MRWSENTYLVGADVDVDVEDEVDAFDDEADVGDENDDDVDEVSAEAPVWLLWTVPPTAPPTTAQMITKINNKPSHQYLLQKGFRGIGGADCGNSATAASGFTGR